MHSISYMGFVLKDVFPVRNKVLIFSGRISSEILLKAAKIGVGVILSKSAPTTLAITLANDLNITAIGFIRDGSFNIYSHPDGDSHRVVGIISSNYSVAYLINFFFNYGKQNFDTYNLVSCTYLLWSLHRLQV